MLTKGIFKLDRLYNAVTTSSRETSTRMNSADQASQKVMEQIMQLGKERDIKHKSTQVSLALPSPSAGAAMCRTREVSEVPLTATEVRRNITVTQGICRTNRLQ